MSGILLTLLGTSGGGVTVISDGSFSGAPLGDLGFGG